MGLDSPSYLSLWGLWVIFLFQPASAAAPSCPSGWITYKKNCYGFFSVPLNSEVAEVECQNFKPNGHLASFHEQEEMTTVGKYLAENYKSGKHIWIGLKDNKASYTVRNRQFIWTDGTSIRNMFWAPGEPNDVGEKELCVDLVPNDFNGWADSPCGTLQPYLCKIELAG